MHPYLRLHLLLTPTGARSPAPASGLRSWRPDRRRLPIATPMLRRALGKVLVETFCPFSFPLCQGGDSGEEEGGPDPVHLCSVAASCPYGVFYASSRSSEPPFSLLLSTGKDAKIDLAEVTLLGPGWALYPWVLSTLQQALRDGLGRQRASFEIDAVIRVDAYEQREQLCAGDLSELPSTLDPDLVTLSVEPFAAQSMVEVELLSPLRLAFRGKPRESFATRTANIPFDVLIASILDRYLRVFPDDGSEILEPEIRANVEAEAAQVPLISDMTRWLEVPGASGRSHRRALFGGWSGRLVYGEDAARFLSILRAGEILHLGDNPSAGCGRISVTLPDAVA